MNRRGLSDSLLHIFGSDAPEIACFGNHHRKYLFSMDAHLEELLGFSENTTLQELLDPETKPDPFDPKWEETANSITGDNTPDLLGALYGLRFLRFHANWVRTLRARPLRGSARFNTYVSLLKDAETSSLTLKRWLLERYLALYTEGELMPRYTFCNVGTLTDHEDVDAAIIVEGETISPAFDSVIQQILNQFLRYASRLHFYLSEYLETRHYWGRIDDYKLCLDREVRNVVIISQIIGASRLCGDRALFNQFQREVFFRYFFRGENTRYHEGFLRGTLAELHACLSERKSEDHLHPKQEIYRPIKMIVAALRTIYNVEEPSIWKNFQTFKNLDPNNTIHYQNLESAYAFSEILRYLFNLYVMEEDAYSLKEAFVTEALGRIASMMGLASSGHRRSLERLLLRYDEILSQTIRSCQYLGELLSRHLKDISFVRRLLLPTDGKGINYRGNVALGLLSAIQSFRGKVFWDDIIALMLENREVLNRFVSDLMELSETMRDDILRHYIILMTSDMTSLFRFLVELAKFTSMEGSTNLAERFYQSTIKCFQTFEYKMKDYTDHFYSETALLSEVVQLTPPHFTKSFIELLSRDKDSLKVRRVEQKNRFLLILHHRRSPYFGRLIQRILSRFPHFLDHIDDLSALRRFCCDTHKHALEELEYRARMEGLGNAFELELVRMAMIMLLKEQHVETSEVSPILDRYIISLLTSTMESLGLDQGSKTVPPKGFAFYATGGNARGEGFPVDYDYLAVGDFKDPALLEQYNQVIQKSNMELARRMMMPHCRFTDYVNSYVITFEELKEILNQQDEASYVDQSQLLDARLIFGDKVLDDRITKEIIEPYVYDRVDDFIVQTMNDMADRHNQNFPGKEIFIKEQKGGLRDIVSYVNMLKARHRIGESLICRTWEKLSLILPEQIEDFKILAAHNKFLGHVRALYHLTVAYEDNVEPLYLKHITPYLNAELSDAARLEEMLRNQMSRAAEIIARKASQIS